LRFEAVKRSGLHAGKTAGRNPGVGIASTSRTHARRTRRPLVRPATGGASGWGVLCGRSGSRALDTNLDRHIDLRRCDWKRHPNAATVPLHPQRLFRPRPGQAGQAWRGTASGQGSVQTSHGERTGLVGPQRIRRERSATTLADCGLHDVAAIHSEPHLTGIPGPWRQHAYVKPMQHRGDPNRF
jgi:hypothetical protein